MKENVFCQFCEAGDDEEHSKWCPLYGTGHNVFIAPDSTQPAWIQKIEEREGVKQVSFDVQDEYDYVNRAITIRHMGIPFTYLLPTTHERLQRARREIMHNTTWGAGRYPLNEYVTPNEIWVMPCMPTGMIPLPPDPQPSDIV